jgi:hypothetical protein
MCPPTFCNPKRIDLLCNKITLNSRKKNNQTFVREMESNFIFQEKKEKEIKKCHNGKVWDGRNEAYDVKQKNKSEMFPTTNFKFKSNQITFNFFYIKTSI